MKRSERNKRAVIAIKTPVKRAFIPIVTSMKGTPTDPVVSKTFMQEATLRNGTKA